MCELRARAHQFAPVLSQGHHIVPRGHTRGMLGQPGIVGGLGLADHRRAGPDGVVEVDCDQTQMMPLAHGLP